MTISSTLARNDYTGSTSVGPYVYGFKITAATDLQVIRRSVAGAETTLTYLTDYTVSGYGNDAGGSITLVNAPLATDILSIRRNFPITQPASIRNQGAYFPSTIEDQLDRAVLIQQQQEDAIARSLKLPPSYNPTGRARHLVPTAGYVVVGDGTGFTTAAIVSTGVTLPGESRTVASLSAYLSNNAVYNVKDFGAVGDGVTDDTAAIQLAIDTAVGKLVRLPAGSYVVSSLHNVPTWPLVLEGDGRDNSILVPTVAANTVIKLDQTNNANNHHLSEFSITGNSTCLGGISMGTSAFRSAFVVCDRIRITGFTKSSAPYGYGLQFNSIQEVTINDCWLQGNYNNVYHPNLGYVTSVVFSGMAGYIGGATNCGVLFEGDSIFDTTFRGCVIESNTNEGVKSLGFQGDYLIEGCYFEDNGSDINLSGSASTGQEVNAQILNNYFAISHASGAKLTLDRTKRGTRIQGNRGLFKSGGVVTTANTVAHFTDNSYGVDAIPLYRALLGTVTWDETDTTGVRTARNLAVQQLVPRGVTITYAASMTPDATAGKNHTITATNSTAFTINAPTGAVLDQELSVTIRAGATLGVATWNAVFKMAAWTQPASGFSRTILFRYNGSSWVEQSRTTVDVPN